MGNTIHHQPLIRCYNSSRSTDTEHELISRLKLLLLTLVTQIPVILHVAAVEFHQAVFVLRDRRCNAILKYFFKRTT
ncbi:hypothetical protein D3C78_1172150 [compost metagenome]